MAKKPAKGSKFAIDLAKSVMRSAHATGGLAGRKHYEGGGGDTTAGAAATGAAAAPTDYTSTLNNLYQQNFNRSYNPSTDSWWAQQLASGAENPANLAKDIISGAQGADLAYYQSHSGANTTTTPTTGTNNLTGILSGTNTTTTPTTTTTTTPDYTGSLNSIYNKFFGRAYNPSTDSYWAQQLQSGAENPANLALDVLGGAQGSDLAYYQSHYGAPGDYSAANLSKLGYVPSSSVQKPDYSASYLASLGYVPASSVTNNTGNTNVTPTNTNVTPNMGGTSGFVPITAQNYANTPWNLYSALSYLQPNPISGGNTNITGGTGTGRIDSTPAPNTVGTNVAPTTTTPTVTAPATTTPATTAPTTTTPAVTTPATTTPVAPAPKFQPATPAGLATQSPALSLSGDTVNLGSTAIPKSVLSGIPAGGSINYNGNTISNSERGYQIAMNRNGQTVYGLLGTSGSYIESSQPFVSQQDLASTADAVNMMYRPSAKELMDATGLTGPEAIRVLYSIPGDTDTRNWQQIMSSPDIKTAAVQATANSFKGTNANPDVINFNPNSPFEITDQMERDREARELAKTGEYAVKRGGAIVDKALNISRMAHANGGMAGRKHLEGGGDSGGNNAPVDTTPAKPTDDQYTAAINKIFQQDLGRPYNPATDSYWLDQFKLGNESLDNLSKLETDIKSGATGGADKAASQYLPTLQNLIQQEYGRAYNPETDSYWLNQLASGAENPANLAKDIGAQAQGRDKMFYNTYNTPQQTQVVSPVQQTPSGYDANLGRYVFNQPNLITNVPLMNMNLANSGGAGSNTPTQTSVNTVTSPKTSAAPVQVAPVSGAAQPMDLSAYNSAYNAVMSNPHYSTAAPAAPAKKRGGSTGSFIKKAIMVVSENKPKRSKRKG